MAADLGWKSVELQIEALVPGIILAFEIHALSDYWFSYKSAAQPWMPSNEFIKVAVFVAISYSLGVVSSILSRAFVDLLSESGPRAWVFGWFSHAKLDALVQECQSADPRFPRDMMNEQGKRLSENIAQWNAVYRSALRRTNRGAEIDRRRSQGRFVRNLFFSAILAPFALSNHLIINIISVVAIAVGMTFLYAYAEYVNFAESYDIVEAKP